MKMSNFAWKGSVDSLSGVATFYPHTEFAFDVELSTFKEAQAISQKLRLIEVDAKRRAINQFKDIMTRAASEF